MLKQVSVMKRHPDLTMEEFIERYENHHAKFGEILFASSSRFVRRYVHPEKNPLTGEVEELDFDVIMEIWWESRDDYQAAMKAVVECDFLDDIRASGEALFASQNNPAFTVEEHDSEVSGPK